MKILVTGGAGFIGSHLCDALVERGDHVICLDNLFTSSRENVAHLLASPRFEFVRGDVCEPFHFEVDQVYHLACPASPLHYQRNPVRTIKTAVLGTLHALELARETGAWMLLASTSEVYGDPLVHPQTENYAGNVNTTGPRACYDEGKRAGEALAASWARQYGTDVRIARLFNCYGPRMAEGDGRLIPNLITQALRGESMTIYGDGSQTRSFCYVSDTVAALLAMMRGRGKPVPINIGNPSERSILSVALDIAGMSETGAIEMKAVHCPLPEDDPKQRCPDISRAKAMLGWGPQVSYEDGLRRTYDWFLQYGKGSAIGQIIEYTGDKPPMRVVR